MFLMILHLHLVTVLKTCEILLLGHLLLKLSIWKTSKHDRSCWANARWCLLCYHLESLDQCTRHCYILLKSHYQCSYLEYVANLCDIAYSIGFSKVSESNLSFILYQLIFIVFIGFIKENDLLCCNSFCLF